MTTINARRLRWAQLGGTQDFSGGPNVRDTPEQLASNEASDSWNVVYDERGGVSSRKGYEKTNSTPFGGGLVHNTFWSGVLNARITQAGTSLYLADTNTARKTFTTSALVTFAELNARVVACHPVDGLWTSTDGITWTHVADADAPVGTCVCTWQNKLYVGTTTGKLAWSNAGDATAWTSTDFNYVWEKDQQPIVALHIGSGQDILGQAGLLVFKQESFYRVNDSSTGTYTTEDATIGCAGPLAVTGAGAKVVWLSKRGPMWWANGVQGAQDGTRGKQLPFWQPDQLNFAQQALWAAGFKGEQVRFSMTRAGSTANDIAMVFHPDQGWVAPGSNAMSCYTTSTGTTETLYGGSPDVTGQVYTLDSTGTDDGVAIDWLFQTRWLNPGGDYRVSVWHALCDLRGAGTFTVLKDYQTSGLAYSFDTSGTAPTYDSGLKYDDGEVYAVSEFQSQVRFFSIGPARQVSFVFTGTSDDLFTGDTVFGGTSGPTFGAFGLFGIRFAYWTLMFS